MHHLQNHFVASGNLRQKLRIQRSIYLFRSGLLEYEQHKLAHHFTKVRFTRPQDLIKEIPHIRICRPTKLIQLGKDNVVQDLILYELRRVLEFGLITRRGVTPATCYGRYRATISRA
jgi:hypothetical protein